MAAYKDKLTKDLDRWIAAGLVVPENRGPILDTVPDARRLDAATALAWLGGVLLGIAAIAFVAANWDELPRLVRFVLILAAFSGAAGAGAWAAKKERPLFANIALTLAALVFAAAVGLTGQIFDIAGDPRAAMYIAGVGASALALAGGSTGAAIAALLFFGLGDFYDGDLFNSSRAAAPWLIVAGPVGVYLALRWRSAPLAHAAAVAMLFALGWFAVKLEDEGTLFLLFSMLLAGATAAARWLWKQDRDHASVFYGWAAWGALMYFAIAGYADEAARTGDLGLLHRTVWLGASGALIALGRYDRHAMATAEGVLSIIGAIAALLIDLGLDLMAAAVLFFLCAAAALIGGLMLRKHSKTEGTSP